MQTIHPTTSDLTTTTVRKYSLVVEANNRVEQAVEAWGAAYGVWSVNPTPVNHAKLIAACEAYKKAQSDYRSVVKNTFPA